MATTTSPLPATLSKQVSELTGKSVRKVSLVDTSIFVRVSFHKLGVSRKLDGDLVTVDADPDLIRSTKLLCDSAEMDAVKSLDARIRQYIKSRASQAVIQDSLWALGLNLVKDFEEQMRQFAEQRGQLADAFCRAYQTIVDNDKTRLRSAFKETDYPTVEKVRSKFGLDWSYHALSAPKSLEAVSEDLYKKAESDIQAQIFDATEAVRLALRGEMKEMVDWAVDRLTAKDDGKQKSFKKAGLAKLREFLDLFGDRNITGDQDLALLVEQAKGLISGIDVSSLRKDEPVRESIKAGFEKIKETVDTWVIDAPGRVIDLD